MTSYRLWPVFVPVLVSLKSAQNTLGNEFSVSQNMALTGIWFIGPAASVILPSKCGIWDISTGLTVTGTVNASPGWSGAAGSGWVKCSYDGSVILVPGKKYYTSVFSAGGSTWRSNTAGYWTSGGDGASGISNGPLSAPNNASTAAGQSMASAADSFPNISGAAQNFWVDVEVSDPVIPVPGLSGAGNSSRSVTAASASRGASGSNRGRNAATGNSSPHATTANAFSGTVTGNTI